MKSFNKSEEGFTLIELLFSLVIMLILSGLAMAAYFSYLDSSEYSRAEATLYHSKLARGVAVSTKDESDTLSSNGFQWSGTNGEDLDADLARILPHMNPGKKMRVGGFYEECPLGSFALNSHLVSQPCRSSRYTFWVRFCNGIELTLGNVSNSLVC